MWIIKISQFRNKSQQENRFLFTEQPNKLASFKQGKTRTETLGQDWGELANPCRCGHNWGFSKIIFERKVEMLGILDSYML